MRFGIVLDPPTAADAALAEVLGFDLAWLDERAARAPLVTVAALAQATTTLRFGASVAAGPHPVTLAEEAAVADLACSGRLVLGLESDDQQLLAETVELALAALAPRPFRHDGLRWRVPARLPEHEQAEQAVRVTPPPAQLELPVWLGGEAAPVVAPEWALSFVSAAPAQARAQWESAQRLLGPACTRLRRPAMRRVDCDHDGEIDVESLVAGLRAEQADWGLDVVLAELPADLKAATRSRAMRTLAASVRPRVQLDRLPGGLERHWSSPNQPVD